MATVKSDNTRPEILVRSLLHRAGFRFRKNVQSLPGKPDVVLPKYKTVIFVHGCFWHRHDCKKGQSMPSNRIAYWEQKFQRTVERDAKNKKELSALGWNVVVIWECELKKRSNKIFELIAYLKQFTPPD